MLVLGAAVRFIHFALFDGTLLSLPFYAIDTAVAMVFGGLASGSPAPDKWRANTDSGRGGVIAARAGQTGAHSAAWRASGCARRDFCSKICINGNRNGRTAMRINRLESGVRAGGGLGGGARTGAGAQVRMAVGGPMTGGSAAFGAQLKQGVEQAVEDINATGGILGQKIVLSVGDDRADPKEGVSAANKFAADGVKFVIGHFNSGVTIPASDVYQENGMLVITPAATNPQVTDRRGMWNVFRVCGRDDQQGGVAGAFIADQFKGKRVAIVHDKTTYGQGLADETRKAMNAKGVKEVMYEGINKDDKDFTALVSKLKAANPDLIYWGGLHDTAGLIVRQMRDQGVKAPLMGGDGMADDEFAAIAGPGAEGTLMTLLAGSAQQPEQQADRRIIPQEARLRAASLYALQLRGAPDHQAGGGSRRNRSTPRRSPT